LGSPGTSVYSRTAFHHSESSNAFEQSIVVCDTRLTMNAMLVIRPITKGGISRCRERLRAEVAREQRVYAALLQPPRLRVGFSTTFGPTSVYRDPTALQGDQLGERLERLLADPADVAELTDLGEAADRVAVRNYPLRQHGTSIRRDDDL
jgi:hypothetical protein